jgi:glycine/D-amino acid oxidase-like deaminating enzyme/nitrite reductase/ring-hydroxylating ferredoxin subunit
MKKTVRGPSSATSALAALQSACREGAEPSRGTAAASANDVAESSKPANEPVWWDGVALPEFPPLRANVRADVCVVGAGIAGLTTAYHLAAEGRSVVVIDDGPLGGGMTGATSAHLVTALDRRYGEIEKTRGEAGARLAAESHAAAIDRIEEIVRREKIACDFVRVDGYLFPANEDDRPELEEELEAALRAGADVEMAPGAKLPFETGPCIRFRRQAQFQPLRYLAGLARALRRRGGRIFRGAHADRIEGGTPARIQAGERKITAKAVVVATNSPVNDRVAIHTKQAPFMTYVIGARVPRDSVARALYWDTHDPFHYVRLQPLRGGSDCLIVGGEDHKTGQADDTGERHGRLEAWARKRFPMIESIDYAWAGQVLETLDGLAFIGRNPGDEANVFVATGDSGVGLTHGTIAGILLTDLILGRPNPWTDLYDPSRKVPRSAGRFLRENLNVAAQYGDWIAPGDVASTREIERDSGAVLRRGASKVAVYRDQAGKLHELSAVCPHLGCLVQWNGAEKTWDCPCHGSRFDKRGKVVNGPANTDLPPAEARADSA